MKYHRRVGITPLPSSASRGIPLSRTRSTRRVALCRRVGIVVLATLATAVATSMSRASAAPRRHCATHPGRRPRHRPDRARWASGRAACHGHHRHRTPRNHRIPWHRRHLRVHGPLAQPHHRRCRHLEQLLVRITRYRSHGNHRFGCPGCHRHHQRRRKPDHRSSWRRTVDRSLTDYCALNPHSWKRAPSTRHDCTAAVPTCARPVTVGGRCANLTVVYIR